MLGHFSPQMNLPLYILKLILEVLNACSKNSDNTEDYKVAAPLILNYISMYD